MTKSMRASLAGLVGMALVSAGAHAADVQYEVSITNLTRGQIFSPPLVVTHPGSISLFKVGYPASAGLSALAQDGMTAPLAQGLKGKRGVRVTEGMGPILPGATVKLRVAASSMYSRLSVATMLVSTNDAFAAASGVALPRAMGGMGSYEVPAYDAGAEDNDEMCAYIPGPPCGNGGAASGVAGEGYVHIHAGVHGGADLMPSMHDWRNPTAKITVRMIGD